MAATEITWTRRFYWSVRREFWENRWIYLAPLAVCGVFLAGFILSAGRLPGEMQAAMALPPIKQRGAMAIPYDILSGLAMLTMIVVGVFYSLDALYGERRDRSTLFWKSLPISDTTTVLAKASVPFIILPLVVFGITFATQILMLLVNSAVLAISGQSVAALWKLLAFPRSTMLLLYHVVTMHGIWAWPIYAWLIMVSAWARRTPFLWAFVPPIALCYFEKITFNSTHLASILFDRVAGTGQEAIMVPGTMPMDPRTELTPGNFLGSTGLWLGLAVTALFLIIAVRLRRARGPA
jgi:ABC-2 type transport system permease protein